MQIHTVKRGETVADIAREYGIEVGVLESCNGLMRGERPTVGEELLVLTPTRTYKARRGDTAERLSMRFGIRRGELFGMNPGLCHGLSEGDTVILKYDERSHGMAASNAYMYSGCGTGELVAALPFATYVSVAEAAVSGEEIVNVFDGSEARRIITDGERIPLLRIYDGGAGERYRDAEFRRRMAERMVGEAERRGYKGITLGGSMLRDPEAAGEFTVELRGRMIGCDLILITELTDECAPSLSELADGSVFSCIDYGGEGERQATCDFACGGESSRTFLELPAFAEVGGGYITHAEARRLARRRRAEVVCEGDICSFDGGRCGPVRYHSLKNIKARLDMISELGFMGISFDIMRTPIADLLMYNALYKTVGTSPVRSREGCSRGYAE